MFLLINHLDFPMGITIILTILFILGGAGYGGDTSNVG